MQDRKIADMGRHYNSSKNKKLGEELRAFLDGKYPDTPETRTQFRKLLSVIAGRLNTL